jgi:hypothetical protein
VVLAGVTAALEIADGLTGLGLRVALNMPAIGAAIGSLPHGDAAVPVTIGT